MANEVDKLRQRMANATPKATVGATGKDREVAAGPRSTADRQEAAEEKIAKAKRDDVEDTRVETSGDERHDLITAMNPNIPPSIVTERLKLGQDPATGEPWSREERARYDRENERALEQHAKAVRESEIQMQKDQQGPTPAIQPVPHVPVSQLTEAQKKAMQDAQNSGKGAIAQAKARDANSPEELGKAKANQMTQREKETGVDEDIEQQELDKADDTPAEEKKDADEVQEELDEARKK